MKTTRWFRLFLILIGAGNLAASAQPAPAAKPVTARFYCLDVTGAVFNGLSYYQGKAEVPVRVPGEFLSPAYEYTGPSRLVFLRKIAPAAPKPGEARPAAPWPPDREPVVAADLPVEGGEFLLLFGRSADGVAKIMPVPFDEGTVPRNGYLFWNLTARPLGVMLGGAKAVVAPAQRKVLTQAATADYMPLRIFDEFDGRERQVFASRHLHREETRQIVFVRDAEQAGRVKIRMITQPKPAPVAVAKAGS